MTTMPAAAPEPLRALLTGSRRPARLLGAGREAAYVVTDDGTVLALLSAEAVRLPFGLVLAPGVGAPWRGLDAGAACTVGAGHVELDVVPPSVSPSVSVSPSMSLSVSLSVTRWWRAPLPRRPQSPGALARGLATLAELLPACDDAPDVTGRPGLDPRLLGDGPGLTPYGDDVLAGRLLALHAARRWHPATAGALPAPAAGLPHHVVALLHLAEHRTTAVSAACLRAAATGHGVPQVVALLDAVGGNGDVFRALSGLLRVGHTSGHGLAVGVLTGLTSGTEAGDVRGASQCAPYAGTLGVRAPRRRPRRLPA